MNLLLQLLIMALILVSALPDDPVQKFLFLAGLCGYVFFRRKVLNIAKCRKLLGYSVVLQVLALLAERADAFSTEHLMKLAFGCNIIGVSLFLLLFACLITVYRKTWREKNGLASGTVMAGFDDPVWQNIGVEPDLFGGKPDPEAALLFGIFTIQSSVWLTYAIALGADDRMFAYMIAVPGTVVILFLAVWLYEQYKKNRLEKYRVM